MLNPLDAADCPGCFKMFNTTGGHREEYQRTCVIGAAPMVVMVIYIQVKTTSGVEVLAHEFDLSSDFERMAISSAFFVLSSFRMLQLI